VTPPRVLVVDASVVSRWFLPGPGTEAAVGLLHQHATLVAPDLLFPELIRLVQREVRHGRLRAAQGRRLLADLARIAVETVPCRGLVEDAWALSAPGRSVADSLYLALAVRLQTYLITADTRVQQGVARTPLLAARVRDVETWAAAPEPSPPPVP